MTALLVCLILAWPGAGCDRVKIDEAPTSDSARIDQTGALRTAIRPTSLSRLYRWSEPQGLPLDEPAKSVYLEGRDVSIGPLEAPFPMERWTSSAQEGQLELELHEPQGNLLIPIRVPREVGVRICRFRLSATNWRVNARATQASGPTWDVDLEDEPSTNLDDPRVTTVGECPELSTGQAPSTSVTEHLIDYAEDALAGGLEGMFESSPVSALGLPQGEFELLSASPFDSRRGRLRVTGTPSESPAPQIQASAIRTALDLGVEARRADCAPLSTVPPVGPSPEAGFIASNSLDESPYAVGFALSGAFVTHLLRASTLAGFGCRGLEVHDGLETGLKPETAELDAVGLADLPLQGPLEVSVSVGGLPDIELESTLNAVTMRTTRLRVDLYGRLRGVRVRLLSASASTEWRAEPRVSGPRQITLSIVNLDVTDPSVDSAFDPELPDSDQLDQWVRRLFQLVLEDQLILPAPLLPDSPLRIENVRIRPDDILFLGRLDPPPSSRP